jgi:hypothetical protein
LKEKKKKKKRKERKKKKQSKWTISHAPRTNQVWCANLITAQVGSFFFFFFLAQNDPFLALVGPFEVWLIVSPCPLFALFQVWLIVSLGPLLAFFEFWPVVGPF